MAIHIQMAIRKNRLFVRLKGELDQAVTEKLKVRISELIDKYEIKYLIFNFEKVNFMDSSGIGLIIGRYNLIKLLDSKLTILNPSEPIKRIIELSSLGRNITLRCS